MLKHSKFEKFLLAIMIICVVIMGASWLMGTPAKPINGYFMIGLFGLVLSIPIYLLIRVASFFDAVDSLIDRSGIFDNFDLKKIAKIVMLASFTTMLLTMFTGNVNTTPGGPEHNLTTQIFGIGVYGLMGSVPVYLWMKWIDLLDWVQWEQAREARNEVSPLPLVQQQKIEPPKTHCLISDVKDAEEEASMKNWVLSNPYLSNDDPKYKEAVLFGNAALIVQGIQPIWIKYDEEVIPDFIVEQTVWETISIFPNNDNAIKHGGILGLTYISDGIFESFYSRQEVEKSGGKFSIVSIAFTHPKTKESATLQVVSASDVLRMMNARM